MLTLLIGTDWTANRARILDLLAKDVADRKGGRILIVPELISHDTERRLCVAAGDTCSRFAQVLSFSRLASRVSDAVGFAAEECLDNGGRVVAMASAARQLHSRLKAYASVQTRPEFLTGLLDAVDEFKRCCIAPADLMVASKQSEGSLAQKLEELSLLLEGYDALCARGKRDPRDQMTWLLEELEESDFASEHVFYIDGFPDFTRQHMAIVEHMIRQSDNVTVSLNCDKPNSGNMSFEKAGQTAGELLKAAKKMGIPVKIVDVSPRQDALAGVREHLFQGNISEKIPRKHLLLYSLETVYQECMAAVERINDLIQEGCRYRDISVVCADMEQYRNLIEMAFNRSHIPMYLSGTEEVLDKSVIKTVLAAMDAALNGFERQDVLRYMKSVLSPLDLQMCDRLENYSILWDVTGSQWLKPWKNHPVGLGEKWTEQVQADLDTLNEARSLVIDPLDRLYRGFRDATKLSEQVSCLYQFFEDISLSERLSALADNLDAEGDNRNAQILNQLWEILLTALEQLYDVLGDTGWDADNFTRLFKLLLSQYDVGTIPPVLDAVSVGPVSAMRCQQAKHLIVLGANEGSLPGYGGSVGVLTDQERVQLRQIGVPLTGGAMDGIQAEFAEIYGVFCGAEETVTVSCCGNQPSFVYRRLFQMAECDTQAACILGAALRDQGEAGAFLVRTNARHAAQMLDISDVYDGICTKRDHVLGNISRQNIRKVYGDKLQLSASQVDKQAQCRLMYFLRYGLHAKERKPAAVDPAEFGTYVHAVMEQTAKEIRGMGGFRSVSLERTLKIAEKHSENYAKERFAEIGTQRLDYLFRRNVQELELIIGELWQEMQESEFEPVGFEVAFGEHGDIAAIDVSGKTMPAQLRGFVDRVDLYRVGGGGYFRVVDYKTGRKDFDYCDIFNGYGLQMLLYLFALEQDGQSILGDNCLPAGVQYFPARVPLVPADGILTDEEAAAARQKLWKRKGLLLSDEQVLAAMETSQDLKRLPVTRKKDGTLTGDIADRRQFALLKTYIFSLVGKMVDDIASGCVTPNPYSRGSSHDACTYCPYSAVCHLETVSQRRNYKAVTAQRFWEDVEKEVGSHG